MAKRKAKKPKNKVMRKISNKTIGKTVDTVADYVDLVSQIMVEYVNQRYKIQQKVSDIRRLTLQTLYNLKTEFVRTIIEALLLCTGVIAIIVGIVMLLSKVVPIEFIFLGYGLLISIIVLAKMKTKP